MADVHTRSQRSYNMSRIRGKDTKPELMLRKSLWAEGIRYRLKSKLPGRPDIVFPGQKVAVFLDGCFWHRCPEHFQKPKTRTDFWMKKISRNVNRDLEVNQELANVEWLVLRIWEHEILTDMTSAVSKIKQALHGR